MHKLLKNLMLLIVTALSLTICACGGDDDKPDNPYVPDNSDTSGSPDDSDADGEDSFAFEIVGTWKCTFEWVYSGIKETYIMVVRRDHTLTVDESSSEGKARTWSGEWEFNSQTRQWSIRGYSSLICSTYSLIDDKLVSQQNFADGSSRTVIFEKYNGEPDDNDDNDDSISDKDGCEVALIGSEFVSFRHVYQGYGGKACRVSCVETGKRSSLSANHTSPEIMTLRSLLPDTEYTFKIETAHSLSDFDKSNSVTTRTMNVRTKTSQAEAYVGWIVPYSDRLELRITVGQSANKAIVACGNFRKTISQKGNGTEVIIPNLKSSTEYTVKVTAYDSSGNVGQTYTYTFTTTASQGDNSSMYSNYIRYKDSNLDNAKWHEYELTDVEMGVTMFESGANYNVKWIHFFDKNNNDLGVSMESCYDGATTPPGGRWPAGTYEIVTNLGDFYTHNPVMWWTYGHGINWLIGTATIRYVGAQLIYEFKGQWLNSPIEIYFKGDFQSN